MKYGMPTLVECKDIVECAKVAKRFNLDFVEVNMSFPQYQVSSLDVELMKKLMDEYGIFYTIHADEGLNPFDFNKSVSKCYFEIMREYIAFAKQLGIPVINMHLLKGVYVTLPGKVILLTDVYKEEYLANIKAFIKMCEEEIADSNIVIAIENVDSNAFTTSQRAALELFMQSKAFGLTLDVGHDMCLSGVDRDVFEKYPDKLMHMHLHDSDGRSAHLPLGTGKVNVEEMLSMKTKMDTYLIEVKTIEGLEISMKQLNEGRV